MKMQKIILAGIAAVVMLMAVCCDQDSDVGSDNPVGDLVNSVVSIGFNIDMSLPSFKVINAAYPEVTDDWITDASMDIIDAVWVVYHDGTSDAKFNKVAPAEYMIKKDNNNGTGNVYAGIANASLVSQNGLTLDVIPVKYKAGYDGSDVDKDCVYYLGNLKDCIVIDQNVALGYNKVFDVTVDGIYVSNQIDLGGTN